MIPAAYWDGDEAKAELLAKLVDAPPGSMCDVGGYPAHKHGDGNWHIAPDDDLVTPIGAWTSVELLTWMCCYHSAHWPVPAPKENA